MSDALLVHPRYIAGAELGRGAQGVVLRVTDRENPGAALVAKVWREGRFSESALSTEFSLLRRLDVPGLTRAHDFARDTRTGAAFFVEDFVAGVTASELVSSAGAQRAERLVEVLSAVASTLGALHEAAFVHGDLKPAHVRVTPAGRVMLLDLGAAVSSTHARQQGQPLLTPAFAAPEVLAGSAPGPHSDLFSLGALGFALASGEAPGSQSRELRALAPWVPPSIADVLSCLLAPHPRDRPASAEAVLGLLGQTGVKSSRVVPTPVGREAELASLLEPRVGVRYLVGPSGSGKSYLLREAVTRALLAGRAVRRLVFPDVEPLVVSELVAFLRGEATAWPFTETERSARAPLLLVFDNLQAAPLELATALDAYRCRGVSNRALDVIAASGDAPDGAESIELGALGAEAFAELCRRLGSSDPARIAELARVSGSNPGWLLASHGRVPLTREMVLERTRDLPPAARELLASVALAGGELPATLLERQREDEAQQLLGAGLLTRRATAHATLYALYAPELAAELAASLGSFEVADHVAGQLLAEPNPSARSLLSLACSAFPPQSRELLLERAAERFRSAGLVSEQTDALLALAGSAARRTPALLLELERLTRSAGNQHPRVLEWLTEMAAREPEVELLALRRRAEHAARSGDFDQATRLAAEAQACAVREGDRLGEALSLGTTGAVALFRADVPSAEAALRASRARLATLDVRDLEELARIDHNLGIVALYRNLVDDAASAFERSLGIKRRLGDRAGVRSCLLNLGLAQARQKRFDEAARTLDEALALARSLRQHAGRAWCLAARADVELRRGDGVLAERFIAEAEAVAQAPRSVRADLCLLRGQLALSAGDAQGARRALAGIEPELRAQDTLIDARARLIEAGALLASLPAAPRAAARLAIAAARAARAARLSEVEAQSLEVLRQARRKNGSAPRERYSRRVSSSDDAIWSFLESLMQSGSPDASSGDLLRLLRDLSGAERALLMVCRHDGTAERAWGVDLDGFPLTQALERHDRELVRVAFEQRLPLYRRDVETPAGRGSQLALPTAGAVLLLEHRFRIGHFDAIDSELAKRFAVLAGLVVRLLGGPLAQEPALSPHSDTSSLLADSTAMPERRRRRPFAAIVGQSRALDSALARLDAATDSELPVLIVGETGTGKELFARALHEAGPRASAPFVAVNCAAIPEALFETELFGHARGAFTGAERARSGLLARADGGTLFLDELGELPLPRQAALLRVLETRRFRPVGSDEERIVDVRIVSATNRSLEAEVKRGNFRQDLLYRVNVIEIGVPALRERAEDISALTRAFLARAGSDASLSADAMHALESHTWPGNVRELEHQIQRLLALGLSRIELKHLPRELRKQRGEPPSRGGADDAGQLDPRGEVERALRQANGNITHAARVLGLTRHGLKKRMLRLGLRAIASGGEPP